ncbi:MAG: transketolase, partial [Fusobacterium sp.]
NKKQLDGTTDEICRTFDLVKKFESFGFDTVRVNGASVEEIDKALEKQKDMPLCIVLDTVKGQGVKYFEELKANHHIRFNDEQKEILKKEIAKLEEEAE